MSEKMELGKKQDYIDIFNKINKPLQKYFSESCAYIRYSHIGVGYGSKIAGIEGFSRLLWGAGPGVENLDKEWLSQIIKGMSNGTNPQHLDYWGIIHHRDQRMVEMPAIALSLLYKDKIIWKQLTVFEKQNMANWLLQIFHYECADGNWQFFKVIVALVLRELDYQVDDKYIDEALIKINACYIDKGWYRDSHRGRQDYYTPFAFHYYGLIYSALVPDDKMSRIFKQRASMFAKEYIHFFAENGANIAFGRSMIYRYAAASFWAALVYAGEHPFDLGIIKGLINRNLRWWMEKPIFDANGILTLGYTYPQLLLTEPYNSSVSPYWANKVFLILALPEEHSFWKVEEVKFPEVSQVQLLEHINMLAVNDNGHAQLLNAGQPGPNYHTLTNEKYLKFAYSSEFAFSIPRSNQVKEEAAMDSMIGVQTLDRKVVTSRGDKTVEEIGEFLVRNKVSHVKVTEESVASTWQVTDNIKIRTWLTAFSGWQIRIHKVESEAEIILYETGFAIENSPDAQGYIHIEDNSQYFICDKGFTGIADLSSEVVARLQTPVNCLPNTNLITCETTCLPGLEVILKEGTQWLVTGVYAHQNSSYAKKQWHMKPSVEFLNGKLIVSLKNSMFVISLNED